MKVHAEFLVLLLLVMPMAAQNKGVGAKSPAAVTVFNTAVQVNGPDGAADGHDAIKALEVKGGRGGDGGLNNTNGGAGGGIRFRAGDGGSSSQDAGGGGDIKFIAGDGGNSSEVGGGGGWITLQPGSPRCGALCGNPGNIILAVHGSGRVGVGTATPRNTLEVVAGGTTLADAWITRSSRRFKSNIQPLEAALEKVERMQGVSYQDKSDGKREIGVVAEEVEQIVPEVVSRDPKTNEVQGVDYSRLAALLIEAVKSQETEIRQLRLQVEQLQSAGSRP